VCAEDIGAATFCNASAQWAVLKMLLHCRDIKPENVLVIHGSTESHSITLKLSDFGIAADLSLLMAPLTEPYGSPEYAAPEVTATVGTRPAGYGMEVDIWSLGVVVFFMLTGHLPFDGPDASTVRRKVSSQKLANDSDQSPQLFTFNRFGCEGEQRLNASMLCYVWGL
jgi:serine/threonine protein kinase